MTNEIKELGKLIEQLVDMLDTEPAPSAAEEKPELSEQVKKTLDAGRERAFYYAALYQTLCAMHIPADLAGKLTLAEAGA